MNLLVLFQFQKLCEKLCSYLRTTYTIKVDLIDLSTVEPEDVFSSRNVKKKCLSLFILPTVTDGHPPEGAKWFCKWLSEAANDFRVDKKSQSRLNFAVFGLGNSAYKQNYNVVSVLNLVVKSGVLFMMATCL